MGRSGSPDLGKEKFPSFTATYPFGQWYYFYFDCRKLNDATKMPYVRAPSPPIGFKYNAKANKR